MPVVLRIGPYVFFFYSLENNEPPHIHVRRDKSLVKFWLEPQVRVARTYGYAEREVRRIRALVEENRQYLLESWHAYFNRTGH